MILTLSILLVALVYFVLIVLYYFGLGLVLSRFNPTIAITNSISVIVAFRNEAGNISKLLDSITKQSLPKDRFELILVNDHSTDCFQSTINGYTTIISNIKLLNLPDIQTGKKAAIAYGISNALYPLIAITDADCEPSTEWLDCIVREAEKGSALILGSVAISPINSFTEQFQSLDYASLMASAAGSCGIGFPVIASSANLAFRNDLLNLNIESLVPSVSSGDDMFLLHHAKRLKCKITFMGQRGAIVRTSAVSTFSEALKQRVRWSSKSVYYTDRDTILVGFVVLLFNLSLIIVLVGSLFNIHFLFYFLSLFVVKTIFDFILLFRYLIFVEQKELLKVFLPLQLIYPFYICSTFVVGFFNRTSWKSRPLK